MPGPQGDKYGGNIPGELLQPNYTIRSSDYRLQSSNIELRYVWGAVV